MSDDCAEETDHAGDNGHAEETDHAGDNGHAEETDHGDAEEDHEHGLPPEDLQYPEFVFESGEIAEDGSFDLEADLDREELREWVEDLAGGLASHDIAVESPDGYVTLGVAPECAQMSFDPDEDATGDFEVSFQMRAKAMFVADDPEGEKVGARGGKGFIPIEALTDGDEDAEYRCYNWIDDPTNS